MKAKKLVSALLTVGVVAGMGVSVLASCTKKPEDQGQYDGPKATELVNKTSAENAKIIYIGTPADGAEQDGKTAQTPYDIVYFFSSKSSEMTPGTIIRVCPGEHFIDTPLRVTMSGAFNDYLIFEAADPTQDTIFNFKALPFASTSRGVELYGNYIYWRNIDVCGAGDNGLYIGGSYNVVDNCEFYNNRDTGLQLGRSYSAYTDISEWPSYNLIKNCTSYNNYDNETYGENADGFAAKLTVGYGNIFDGCIAYRNSDDGWDLFGKSDTGYIGRVLMFNCVAFENGFVQWTQKEYNEWFGESYNNIKDEPNLNSYITRDGDGNGFKLGGSTLAGDSYLENCLSFHNRMHGVTDNSNPGVISVNGVTCYNNGAQLDNVSYLDIHDENGNTTFKYAETLGTTPNTIPYYNVDHEGYIIDQSNIKVILDESGTWIKEEYVALDEDGYICTNSKTGDQREYYYSDDAKTQKVKGSYVKANLEACTVNPDFGKIDTDAVVDAVDERCNNIDIERSEASYNSFSRVLSYADQYNYTGKDRYRGSGYMSLLNAGGKWSKFTTPVDADYLNGKKGEEVANAAATDIFQELPALDFGFNSESSDIHENYRNPDHSINFKNLFKIKDYSILLGEDNKIGCDLSKSSWAEYPHYEDYIYMTDGNFAKSRLQAVAWACQSLIYVPCDEDNCFQNFELITKMTGCEVEWTSSNPDVLKIGEGQANSISNHYTAPVDVTRPEEDTVVTLTANIKFDVSSDSPLLEVDETPETVTLTKKFDINVKAITYEIGDLIVEGIKDGNVIMEQFSTAGEPAITLTNAADYSGKLVPEGKYEVETRYFYAEDKNKEPEEVLRFVTNNPGLFEIQKTITIGEQSKTFDYKVYVVSGDAQIDFMGEPDVSVKHDGFNISGELNNVSGAMYVLVSDTVPTKEQVKQSGQKIDITWDEISFDFENANDKEYTIYFVVCNPNGDITSELHSKKVEIVHVATTTDFANLVQTGGDSSKIYQLTSDLDFKGISWTAGKTDTPFKGVLDGRGHTIKNISATPGLSAAKSKATVFACVEGGAIMNVNFENIILEGKEDVGIVGATKGGYFYNINLRNISATGNQRIGGLIGHAYEQGNSPLIIDRVSLINNDSSSMISGIAASARAGGILGFVQSNNGASGIIEIMISNCYVKANIGTDLTKENGGIVAVYDSDYQNATVKTSLTITNCYFDGVVKAESRCSGILGYHKGLQTLRVKGCLNTGAIYHAHSTEPLSLPQKNASGILGGYSAAGDVQVQSCYSNINEHNVYYDVLVYNDSLIVTDYMWNLMGFDMENVWEYVKSGDDVVEPFVRLRTISFN